MRSFPRTVERHGDSGDTVDAKQHALRAAWSGALDEARAFLADPLLGARLRESVRAMPAHRSAGASAVLGELDALKFRSCLTVFSLGAPAGPMFADAPACFFAGEPDPRTLMLLAVPDGL